MSRKEDRDRAPDIEAGATVRMKKLRFEEKFDVVTQTHGSPARETETVDERENLPDEIEPGKTYRNASIRKHVAVRIDTDTSDR